MSREDLHFRLRIPPALKQRLEQVATANRRSMTAEIVRRLELSMGGPIGIRPPTPDTIFETFLDGIDPSLSKNIRARAQERGESVASAMTDALRLAFPDPSPLQGRIADLETARSMRPTSKKELSPELIARRQSVDEMIEFFREEVQLGYRDLDLTRFAVAFETTPDGNFRRRRGAILPKPGTDDHGD